VLALEGRTAQAAFRDLIAECAKRSDTLAVTDLLVLAAIEVVRKPASLERLRARGAGMTGTVFVGDYAFVVTPAAVGGGHVGLCKELIEAGKCVVWLVAGECEAKAVRLLRSYRVSRRVDVRRIEDFFALRALFSSWDKTISEQDAVRLIVERCNELLRERATETTISMR